MIQGFSVIYVEILLFLGLITIYNSNKSQIGNKFDISIVFMAIPILYFYYTIFSGTVNIPFKDDYVLLDSIYQMEFSNNFMEWLKAFLKQVNQHRFGFERGAMWAIYKVYGNENIKAQIIIGNSFLLGILFLFFKVFRGFKLPIVFFTPLPLLLFNLTYFENATWGIAAIQNTPIIFFALLTVHFLSLNTIQNYFWALFFATVTLFTSGNGIGIWFVGVLILIFQRNWKKLIIWSLIMICLLTFYFTFDYEIIPSDKANLLKHPFLNLLYILAFWGNIFFQNIPHPNFGHRYLDIMFCILTGIFLTVIILGILWQILKNKFKNISYKTFNILGGMAFLACTGLMLVLSRPVEIRIVFGGEILSRRYMLFGAVFLSLGYLGYLLLTSNHKKIQKFGLFLFITIGLFINISSYYTSLSDVYKQNQELKLDGYYWKNHQMFLTFGEKYGEKMGYNHPTYMINLINKLDSSGIYKLSQSEILPIIELIKSSNQNNKRQFEGRIDTTKSIGITIAREKKDRLLFKITSNPKSRNLKYLALKSRTNTFLLPLIPKVNSLKQCFFTQSQFSSEYEYEIWKDKFPIDLYETFIVERDFQQNTNVLSCKKAIQL